MKHGSNHGSGHNSKTGSVRVVRTTSNELKAPGRSAPSVRGDRNVQGQNRTGAGKKHP